MGHIQELTKDSIKSASTESLERFQEAQWNHCMSAKTVSVAELVAEMHTLVEVELTERYLGAM